MTPKEMVPWICERLKEGRERGERLNPQFPVGGLVYGPAFVLVTHRVEVWTEGRCVNPGDESVLTTFWWDHTHWSLEEAIDMAKRGEGKVYVGQYLYTDEDFTLSDSHNASDPEGLRWVDEGIKIEVWPNWTGEVPQ